MTELADSEIEAIRAVLVRAVRHRCPASLADRADDIVQNALLKVVALRREGKGSTKPSYLWRVAWTATVDELRRQRHHLAQASTEETAEPASPPGSDPEERARAAQLSAAVSSCLQGLVDRRRQAVTLYLLGHSVPEIAARLGWTVKAAENSVYRGLPQLRACLESKGATP